MSISMFPCCKFTEQNQIVTLQKKGSNVVWKSKDTKATLIGKFTLLFFSQIATGMLFRLEYRLLDVITGKSLRRGIQKGRRAFQAEALDKMLKNETKTFLCKYYLKIFQQAMTGKNLYECSTCHQF